MKMSIQNLVDYVNNRLNVLDYTKPLNDTVFDSFIKQMEKVVSELHELSFAFNTVKQLDEHMKEVEPLRSKLRSLGVSDWKFKNGVDSEIIDFFILKINELFRS